MRSIRSGKGIGDNLYLQSVVRHLVAGGERIEVCTPWPDLFRPLRDRISLSPFRRDKVDLVSHYTKRKKVSGTDQFQDCCINVGIKGPVDLRLDWIPQNLALIDHLGSAGKPVIIVQLPREPFGRSDGYGMDLLPDCKTIQRAIDAMAGRAHIVQIGSGKALHKFNGIDLDLVDRTSVSDLIDVASAADGCLGYCSFMVPLAETFSKPALLVWSRKGLRSRTEYIRTITPEKILHRASSRFVVDDCSDQEIAEAADALLDQAGDTRALRRQENCDRRQRAGCAG